MTYPTGHPVTSITIDAINPVAAGVLHCRLTAASPLAYQPGHYSMVAIHNTARAYSFATPPGSLAIEFLISTTPGGIASQFWSAAQPGQQLTITSPYGDFLLREDDHRPLLYIAGGAGFAPIRAHILWLIAHQSQCPITLIIGHGSLDRMFWNAELTALAAKHGFSYRGIVGRPLDLLDTIPNLPAHTVYICGSAGMCTTTAEALYQRDVPPSQVHYELFT